MQIKIGIPISLGDNLPPVATRTPWYCAGCPHNSGTKTPDDQVTGIGIGCHSIGYFLHPEKLTNFSQMGGEGGHWIGRAPFSNQINIVIPIFKIINNFFRFFLRVKKIKNS